MQSYTFVKGITGASLIGSLYSNPAENITIIPSVLAGELDENLSHGFYCMESQIRDCDVDPQVIKYAVEAVKSHLRQFIQNIFTNAAREDDEKRNAHVQDIRVQLANSSKPHEMGTVAEIAAKYNISKSEVRRRKADGTLPTLQA